jgi:hypothetical protein
MGGNGAGVKSKLNVIKSGAFDIDIDEDPDTEDIAGDAVKDSSAGGADRSWMDNLRVLVGVDVFRTIRILLN